MEFKVNLALFKATEDSLKARYGDKYDPSKKYPQYNGTMQVTQMDIVKMVNYLLITSKLTTYLIFYQPQVD